MLTSLLQLMLFLYRNGIFTSRGCPRAVVTYIGTDRNESNDDNSKSKGDERPEPGMVCVTLSRPLRVHAGQYINLWMSSVNWLSWTQSHPITIMSWSPGEQSTLELLVQPCRGLTADLFHHVELVKGVSLSFPAFISGPHGISEPARQYETVLMVASGFGIAAVIPYLKQLIYEYNTDTARTRRVHFVWLLSTLGQSNSNNLCIPSLH